jgi:NitT/TauT family transport system substrate-binding protein
MRLRVLLAAIALALAATTAARAAEKIIIAEPVHGTGYLPLYVGIHKGFFSDEGLDVSAVTMLAAGAHRNATLTKQSWGFIGRPEHNAFVKAKGGELRTIVNIVNRGNVYLVARKGLTPPAPGELASFLRGKTIATGPFGTTPNSITRYVLVSLGLNPQADAVCRKLRQGMSLQHCSRSRPTSASPLSLSSPKASSAASGTSRSTTPRVSLGPTPTRP